MKGALGFYRIIFFWEGKMLGFLGGDVWVVGVLFDKTCMDFCSEWCSL